MSWSSILRKICYVSLNSTNILLSIGLLVYGDDEQSKNIRTALITASLLSQAATQAANLLTISRVNEHKPLPGVPTVMACDGVVRTALGVATIASEITGASAAVNVLTGLNTALGVVSTAAAENAKSSERHVAEIKATEPAVQDKAYTQLEEDGDVERGYVPPTLPTPSAPAP